MGKGFNPAGAAVGGPAGGFATGSNPLTKALGLSGEQGSHYKPNWEYQNPALDEMQRRQGLQGHVGMQKGIEGYASGKMGLEDSLNQADWSPEQADEMRTQMALDPMTGSKLATEQVQNNAILGQLFGKGGSLERYGQEEQDLAKRGYSLQPEDYEAYGQASGDIARQFGEMENQAASSLAARGLAAAPSGAAGATFSGLAGNKAERLGKMQTDIAQRRMQMNMDRLNSVRSHVAEMGRQGAGAIQDQYGRNLQGIGSKRSFLSGLSDQYQQKNQMGLQNEGNRLAGTLNQQEREGKTLLQGLGSGLYGSSVKVGNIPGNMASSAAGAAPV